MTAPRSFLSNSGAEVVDGAIKFARRVTGRPGIVAFRRGFHGRTMGRPRSPPRRPATGRATTRSSRRCTSRPTGLAPGDGALEALDELFEHQATPGTIAAMIVEPVLGEGGYVVPPVDWLTGLRERCDEHGILLVFDEVQTGFGRTGRPFAAETFRVFPDVLLFAKGVASSDGGEGLVLAPIAASNGKGEASWRAKWWTRK